MSGPIAAVVKMYQRVGSAIETGRTRISANVGDLRESAIEPLPQIERMPVDLRKLAWEGKPNRPVDAASIVRRLHGAKLSQDEHNELGCAYALLAWRLSLDEYWLMAIDELGAAREGSDAAISRLASKNLEHVSTVSGFSDEP